MSFKSGFVAIIGRPNVGKSTLLNLLAKKKVAAISKKPQTTRHSIRAVVSLPNAQIILIDTPGLHKPKDMLGSYLNQVVMKTLREVDAVAFLVDVSSVIGQGDCYIADVLKKVETPVFLLLNKTDLVDKKYLEAQLEVARCLGDFRKTYSISSLTGKGVDQFIEDLVCEIPEGPKYYPEETITDQPEQLIIAEFIREKAIEMTREEVPYSLAVKVEDVSSRQDKDIIDVSADLYVEKESQKGIIIGKQGKVIAQIGKLARQEIEALLGSQVNLQLRVKVKKKWRKDESELKRLMF